MFEKRTKSELQTEMCVWAGRMPLAGLDFCSFCAAAFRESVAFLKKPAYVARSLFCSFSTG